MPAANLTELFDFEGQFENAAQDILADVLIAAYKTGHGQQVPVTNTGVRFDVGPALEGKFIQLTKPTNWPAMEDGSPRPPPQEYFLYTGTLEFWVDVPRDDNAATVTGVDTMLSQIRGMIREVMMQCVRPFTETNLPHYKVSRIRPAGTTTGPGEKLNTDRTILRYELSFEIRKTAWPAWIES